MVTSNVIQRMFKIRTGDSQGSAFTVERHDRQYLVTARHVLDGAAQMHAIEIWYEQQWWSLDLTVVGMGEHAIDVAVLTATSQLSPTHPLGLSMAHIVYSQPAYILGFPLGLHSGGAELNRGLPFPFVKSGTISAMEFGDVKRVYIDTHANEGFSGGPVVYHPHYESKEPNELRVAGVVTGYLHDFLGIQPFTSAVRLLADPVADALNACLARSSADVPEPVNDNGTLYGIN